MQTDITIIGGGPVGLYLAGILLTKGISCKVLEKKPAIDKHSKSLGIHPVSLELFEKAGIIKPFLSQGLKIERGIAFWNRDKIGEISFEKCPPPFPFILAIPQWQTEQILQEWVHSLDADAIIRSAKVTDITQTHDEVLITYNHSDEVKTATSKYVVGCDGKNSFLRDYLNIPFEGKSYPDTYIMGDFSDNTSFGNDAAVYLHEDGLIESFPLPNGHRRWVVKTEQYIENPTADLLISHVDNRLGHNLDQTKNFMMSSFGVQNLLASTLHKGRFLLAGDAAHTVSPIGGQGMNLGWMGAELCANAIHKAFQFETRKNRYFDTYSHKQKKLADHVASRAEMNMHLGRKESSNLLYKMGIYFLIRTRLSHFLAKIFTMRGLGKWII